MLQFFTILEFLDFIFSCQPVSQHPEGLMWATLVHWKENVDLDKFVGSEINIFRYEYELFCWRDTGCESGQSRVETCDVTHAQKPVLLLYLKFCTDFYTPLVLLFLACMTNSKKKYNNNTLY